jgi:adenylate kinase
VNVLFLGAPGAGKGTQAQAVEDSFGLIHLATGDLLRDAVRRGTDLGKQAKGYMDRGELVPDPLIIALVMDRLSRPDAAKGALFDGFPRNLRQAEALDEALARKGERLDVALYLKVPDSVLVSRLAGRWECPTCQLPYHELANPPKTPGVCDRCGGPLTQRPDDRPETVKRRLQVFLEQTEPLLKYYRDRGVLVEVNGDRPISEVTREILAVVAADAAEAATRTRGE